MNNFTLLHKIELRLKWDGTDYAFQRNKKNSYGEPTGELETVGTIRGLFHKASSGYITLNPTDGATIQTKSTPMMFALYDNAIEFKQDDFVFVNKQKYKLTGVDNINEMNKVWDISLEKVI